MKRFVCMFIIAALGLALCACTHTPASVPTPAPAEPYSSPAAPQFSLIPATPAPQESGSMADISGGGTELGEADGVTYSEERVFYPEGADEVSALFTLEYTLPVFGGGFIGADNANAEVAEYKDELLTRAAEEYLTYADGESAAYALRPALPARAGLLTYSSAKQPFSAMRIPSSARWCSMRSGNGFPLPPPQWYTKPSPLPRSRYST